MEIPEVLNTVVRRCLAALQSPDAQSEVEAILLDAAGDPRVAAAIEERIGFVTLEDLAIHRSSELTMLAGAIPPGFRAAPHNHNLWSVVGVCGGQEDNEFYERDGDGLKLVGQRSVTAPGVLANAPEAIHAIQNPLEVPLLALHAYGGDLFATPRSNWDPETQREIPFDWKKVGRARP